MRTELALLLLLVGLPAHADLITLSPPPGQRYISSNSTSPTTVPSSWTFTNANGIKVTYGVDAGSVTANRITVDTVTAESAILRHDISVAGAVDDPQLTVYNHNQGSAVMRLLRSGSTWYLANDFNLGELQISNSGNLGSSLSQLRMTGTATRLGGGGGTTINATLDVTGSAAFGSGATKSTFTSAGTLLIAAGSSVTVPAGTGGMRAMVGGVIIYSDYSNVQTTTTYGTGEITMSTAVIAGNTFTRNGDCVRVTMSVQGAANGNTKTPRLRFNTHTTGPILNQGSITGSKAHTLNQGEVCRVDATTAIMIGSSAANPGEAIQAADFTLPLSIYGSCQATSASDGDCSFTFMRTEFVPAP